MNMFLIAFRTVFTSLFLILLLVQSPISITSLLSNQEQNEIISTSTSLPITYRTIPEPMIGLSGHLNNTVLDLSCIRGRKILFAGHCIARAIADNIRWHFNRSSKPNLNPRGHHVWVHSPTNTRIDHVFFHASDMPQSRLNSVKAVNYTDVVITGGLWEMFTMDDVGTAYKTIVHYFTALRNRFPTSRFIVMNNYHLAPAAPVFTMQHVCTTKDRQEAYRDIIRCAASQVFNQTTNSKNMFQYYDPAYITETQSLVSKYRTPDGIHYDRLSPIGMELGRAIARGLCNLSPHPLDNATCLPQYVNQQTLPIERVIRKHNKKMRCHVACHCHGLKDLSKHPPDLCRYYYKQNQRQVSMRTCYSKNEASSVSAVMDYAHSLEVCAASSKKNTKLCYDHESVAMPMYVK